MNKVKEFLNEVFGEVRAFEENGVLWFVASDIARVLEYSTTQKVTEKVDEEDYRTSLTLTNGGEQSMITINESGLYQVIMSVTKKSKERYEKAREFKRWICGTVIPALRKDSGYIDGEEKVATGEMSEDELILKAINVMQGKIARLTQERDRYSRFIGDKMSKVTKKELAQRLNCTPIRLAKVLKAQEIYTPKSNEIAQWFLDINKDINVTVKDDYSGVSTSGKEFDNKGWQYTGEGAVRVVKFLEERDLVKYSDNNGFVLQ